VGQSVKQVPVWKKQLMFMNSLLIYFKKWHPWWQATFFWILRPIVVVGGLCIDIKNQKKKKK
jgi:hypothetical protein